MEIRDVEAFLAVAEELHFGRAAARLNMTQPPVTRAIHRLELEHGVMLFDRTTRRVGLSAAGAALVEPAREFVAAHRAALEAVRASERGDLGTVRVVFAGASTHVMVGRLAQRVRTELPNVTLTLESGNYLTQDVRRVAGGEADIGLGRWDYIPAGVRTRVLAVDGFCIVLPIDHPLAERRSLSMRDVANEPFVALPGEGNWLSAQLTRLAHGAGFEPYIVQEAPDSWTLMALVAEGIGCGLTLTTIASNARNGRVASIPLSGEDGVAGDLRIGWSADRLTPVVRSVLRIAEEVLPTPEEATPLKG